MHIYHKYTAGDIKGALEAQYKLNPVRLAMDAASFPVAAKDMAQMRGRKVGAPYLPNKLTGPGKAFDKMHSEMKKATKSRNCHDILFLFYVRIYRRTNRLNRKNNK